MLNLDDERNERSKPPLGQGSASATCHGSNRDGGGASSKAPSRVIPVVPSVAEKSFGRNCSTALWPTPELDSAAGAGLLSRLTAEGRQHSGRAFSNSSLADSVGSLTHSVADFEIEDHSA